MADGRVTRNKGGRPPQGGTGQTKRQAMNFKVLPAVRQRIEDACEVSGLSMAQEVERRLLASFDYQDAADYLRQYVDGEKADVVKDRGPVALDDFGTFWHPAPLPHPLTRRSVAKWFAAETKAIEAWMAAELSATIILSDNGLATYAYLGDGDVYDEFSLLEGLKEAIDTYRTRIDGVSEIDRSMLPGLRVQLPELIAYLQGLQEEINP